MGSGLAPVRRKSYDRRKDLGRLAGAEVLLGRYKGIECMVGIDSPRNWQDLTGHQYLKMRALYSWVTILDEKIQKKNFQCGSLASKNQISSSK
jgi:hypothetical protein